MDIIEGGKMKKVMKQSKLIFLLNLLSALLIVLAMILLVITITVSKAADSANEDRFLLTEYATRFMNASTYLTGEARAYAATGDIKHYDNYMRELNETKNREICLEQMKAIGLSSESQQIIDYMMSLSTALVPQEIAAMDKASNGDYLEAAKALLISPYNNTVTDLNENKTKFVDVLSKDTSETVNNLVLFTRIMEIFTFIVGLAVIMIQIVSYRIIRKRVIIPIIAVEEEARRIAAGELTNHFNLEPDTSEIGMLIDSMQFTKKELYKYIKDISEKLSCMANHDLTIKADLEYIGDFAPIQKSLVKIIYALNDSFRQFDNAADQVAANATQVSSGAVSLADGAMQQVTSIEEISEAISLISEQIKFSSDQSEMASTLAIAAGVELNSSNEQLQGMLAAMTEISDASDEIGKIIKTIEEIAFQTNILALNAGVEAARAGEAGKGFAVVANEVRDLAAKSAEATNTTSEMIENSLETIQNGAKIAKEASNTFVKVMINAEKAARAMVAIKEDSKNQVASIKRIDEGIGQISEVVQANSAYSEEAASASEELECQAEELRSLVRQYMLNSEQNN